LDKNRTEANDPIFSVSYKIPMNYMGLFGVILFSIVGLTVGLREIILEENYPFGIALLLGVIFVDGFSIVVGIPKTIEVIIYKDKIQFSDWYGHFTRPFSLYTIAKSKIEYITKRGDYNLSINVKKIGEKNYNCIPIQGLPKKDLEKLIRAIEKTGIEMRKMD
jgi:hypothetical protein